MHTSPALEALTAAGIDHDVVDVGRSRSVEEHAAKQGIEPRDLLKTLVLRRSDDEYLFVLVPGDRQIDWPKLRAHLGVNRISLPDADEAHRVTGYERGTITPFGSTTPWPVVADASIQGRGRVAMGSGIHGVSVHLDVEELLGALDPDLADVTTD